MESSRRRRAAGGDSNAATEKHASCDALRHVVEVKVCPVQRLEDGGRELRLRLQEDGDKRKEDNRLQKDFLLHAAQKLEITRLSVQHRSYKKCSSLYHEVQLSVCL